MITINLLPHEVPHRHAKRDWCAGKRAWKRRVRTAAVIVAQSALLVHLSMLGAFLVPGNTVHADTMTLGDDTGQSGELKLVDEPKTPPPVILTVHSSVDEDSDGTYDVQDGAGWTWNVDGVQHNITAGTPVSLPAGTYGVSQNLPAGFLINDLVCDGTSLGAVSAATITLAGDDTNCAFLAAARVSPPPATGTMTVHADIDTDSNGSVDQANAAGWTWNIVGVENTIAANASRTVAEGTYTISEDLQNGYRVADFTCNGTSYGAVSSASLVVTSAGLDCAYVNAPLLSSPPPPVPVITLKTAAPASVNASENIVYTLTWSVAGAGVSNATIADTVPANTTFVSADCGTTTGTCAAVNTNGTVSWNLGSRLAQETGTVTFTVKTATPVANGTIVTNTGTFSSEETGAVSATATTTIKSASVLGLTQTDSPDPIQPGGTLLHTLNWSVSGTSPVTNLTLSDPLPAGLAFVAASNGGMFAGGTVTWALGQHMPGDSGSVTATTTVGTSVANGTVFTNTATLASVETALVSASQTTTVTSPTVNVPAPGSVLTTLSAGTTVDLAFANPGDMATYTVTVTNTGTAQATKVELISGLPAGLTFVDGGASAKTFSIGNLDAGKSATVTFAAMVSATQSAGTYTYSGTVKADNASPVFTTANLEVRVPVVLSVTTTETEHRAMSLTKSTSKTELAPGDSFRATLILKNTGKVELSNVRIHDALPTGFHYSDTGSSKRVWAIGTLMIGETRIIRYDVMVDQNVTAGQYDNKATASADVTPSQRATSTVTVHAAKVLGATTVIPSTGADWRLSALFSLAISLMLTSLWGMARLRRFEISA